MSPMPSSDSCLAHAFPTYSNGKTVIQAIKVPTIYQSRRVEKHACQTSERLLRRLVVHNVYGEFNGNAVNWDSSASFTGVNQSNSHLTPVLISVLRIESFHGCLQTVVNLTSNKMIVTTLLVVIEALYNRLFIT